MSKHRYSTWVEVNLKAIKANFRAIKRLSAKQFAGPELKGKGRKRFLKAPHILAVIKADAYGHGMLKVAQAIDNLGVQFFGVSDLQEGIALRQNGIKRPILLFESTLPTLAKDVIDYNLMPTVCTLSLASALNTYAKSRRRIVDVHVKVDTGMGRLGIWHQEADEFIRTIIKMPQLAIKGIYTHFPIADTNPEFTKNQIKILNNLVKELDIHADIVPYVHAANSMGLSGYKSRILNLARPGLMLYGLYPVPQLRRKVKLIAAMSVKTRIIFIKRVKRGFGVSYGHTFIASRDMTIATLPVGYNDGYLRCLSNKSHVLVSGKRCPVIGRVTMDQMMIDISQCRNVQIGDEVTILGTEGRNTISADELAREADTINYEIVCNLGNRLPRIYKG